MQIFYLKISCNLNNFVCLDVDAAEAESLSVPLDLLTDSFLENVDNCGSYVMLVSLIGVLCLVSYLEESRACKQIPRPDYLIDFDPGMLSISQLVICNTWYNFHALFRLKSGACELRCTGRSRETKKFELSTGYISAPVPSYTSAPISVTPQGALVQPFMHRY